MDVTERENQESMVRMKKAISVSALGLSVLAVGWSVIAAAATVQLQGAGATFPYPLYSKWFSEFQKARPGVTVNYQSIGSGGGIRQVLAGTVDFGASDAPMTDEELARAKKPIVHVPTVLGAVVLSYQVPGLATGLKIGIEEAADLFLGKITSWDDPRLAALNPGVKLPKLSVIPIYRSDGSGTTAIFTDALSKGSAAFRAQVGAGKAVKWPAGLGGKGNEGVSGLVKQTPGAVGYVELVYAAQNRMDVMQVKNPAGEFVQPSVESVTAAAAGVMKAMPADFRISITLAPGKRAYPISGFTYLLVPSQVPAEKRDAIQALLGFCLKEGQAMASQLHYAPLPAELVGRVKAALQGISAGNND
jgi:phosphate transport system substrate-binding protein